MTTSTPLRDDAIAIWKAGVAAVDSSRLVRNVVAAGTAGLQMAGRFIPWSSAERILVVGAGKAGAGMAAGLESSIPPHHLERVSGWVNIPEDCVRPLRRIQLHGARPAGLNEPTAAGVEGSLEILRRVRSLGPNDLCIVLLSGGGSALLPAPIEGITLEDKQQATRSLMHAGASIQELNTVRKRLSRIKGGRLASACSAGTMITLIISDVIGDPLDVIASGPTVADQATAAEALAIVQRVQLQGAEFSERIVQSLRRSAVEDNLAVQIPSSVQNIVIGNNAFAVQAAADEAQRRGYSVQSLGSDLAGEAHAVGRDLAQRCDAVLAGAAPIVSPACLLSGGEPVVRLAKTDLPRKGGRNQEVALAVIDEWKQRLASVPPNVVVLSGGTDGEDGPTDAAGAIADQAVVESANAQSLDSREFLAINNSYEFFARTGGLLKTGPTHTNVMDLRVALIGHAES